ncbi:uncharacterized serine-rich protein C215.13-like [Abrus precatorius]|uniref:Uncharacterized serine-rich protein C215.13-like n=1 Tax=Abrus precatorius TaxID=3816 RepID=A0A8B8JPY4_ABRPR|nr:uncharacterized serine-rich protein C215.13-like [Abrus precatorius]
MEVVVQSPSSPTMDTFDFGGAISSSYLSAPSSPKRFGEYNYLSAPASPSRFSQLYSEFDYFSSTTPIEAAAADDDDNGDGFAFYVNRESDNSSRSAEELFDGGKIKPLNDSSGDPSAEQRRGRERDRTSTTTLSSSNSGRRVTRSHSPFRKSSPRYTSELEEHHRQQQPRSNKEETTTTTTSSSNSGASLSSSSSKGSRRWWLRDFLLFRSASEGRGSSKDPLKKYYKKNEEVKGSSFRSSDSSSPHGSRRRGHVSAHELHYAMKKAESADMKKRTYLPYKQGILGRLAGFGL